MDPDRPSQRTERSAETWRSHIIRQLKHRDLSQTTMFRDLMRFYTQLLEKTSLTKAVLSCTNRRDCADSSSSLSSLQEQTARVKKITGELAYQVVELQQQIQIKTCFLQDQQASLQVEKSRLESVLNVRQTLQKQVDHFNLENRELKEDYDTLLERQRWAESKLREEKVQEEEMLEKMLQLKNQAAARMNNRNERRSRCLDTHTHTHTHTHPSYTRNESFDMKLVLPSTWWNCQVLCFGFFVFFLARARQATLQKDLQMAARSKVTIDSSSSAPSSRSTSPKPELQESRERRQTRLFRSASVASPRMFSSFRELFEKRRGHSVSSPKEDLLYPVGFCVSARVPARSLQVLEAHEQGINAVRFSFSSDLLATGGTDRVVKLWELRAGSLTHRATLDGSTEGITSVAFDHMGQKVLAASYDKSALLWRVDDSVPKLTLTGHNRKVTAARFTWVSHQVVTGSLDRTIRLWDLQRTACVQQVEVVSSCSDLVCSENSIISGHFDCKIRVWDSRVVSCIQELPAQGRVTSLDLSYDRRQLLSCCRDDCLQLVDLRRWSNERLCFRAEGFICGSDSTRAVISPDGCYLAAGSADGAVYIWNVSTGTLETRLPDKHSSSISAVSWAPSGEYVVSVDRSRRAILWSDI